MRGQAIEFKWFFRFAVGLFLILGAVLWIWPSRADAAEIGAVSVPIPLARPAGVQSAALDLRGTARTSPPVSSAPSSPSGSSAATGPGTPGRVLDRIMNVVILGDSLGDGLWAGLYRELKADGRFNLIKRSKVSTGFVRKDYFDWNAEVENVLAEEQVDIAVVLMGTNDRQVLVDDDGQRYSLRSPGWEAAYKERVDRFTKSLTDRGVLVYWVGLPVMRSPRFGRDMQYFNTIYAERAAANGIPFIPTWNDIADESGSYSAYGSDTNGRHRLLRADDGIHFTLSGYRVLASLVADDLVNDRNAGIVPDSDAFARRSAAEPPVSSYEESALEADAAADGNEAPLFASSINKDPLDAPELRPGRTDDWRWPRL